MIEYALFAALTVYFGVGAAIAIGLLALSWGLAGRAEWYVAAYAMFSWPLMALAVLAPWAWMLLAGLVAGAVLSYTVILVLRLIAG